MTPTTTSAAARQAPCTAHLAAVRFLDEVRACEVARIVAALDRATRLPIVRTRRGPTRAQRRAQRRAGKWGR
jgi:hypothetical protein